MSSARVACSQGIIRYTHVCPASLAFHLHGSPTLCVVVSRSSLLYRVAHHDKGPQWGGPSAEARPGGFQCGASTGSTNVDSCRPFGGHSGVCMWTWAEVAAVFIPFTDAETWDSVICCRSQLWCACVWQSWGLSPDHLAPGSVPLRVHSHLLLNLERAWPQPPVCHLCLP